MEGEELEEWKRMMEREYVNRLLTGSHIAFLQLAYAYSMLLSKSSIAKTLSYPLLLLNSALLGISIYGWTRRGRRLCLKLLGKFMDAEMKKYLEITSK